MSGTMTPTTGIYLFQVKVNFLRHPEGKTGFGYAIKWKRGSKSENKGVLGPVEEQTTTEGDYVFNQLFSFKSTMQRKDTDNVDRGFHHKWMDISVLEMRGGSKDKVFDSEFDLGYALPPRSDTTPHILLDKHSNTSLSLSIGYRRIDNGPKPSFFSCASYATPATNNTRGMAPEAALEPKRRTRSTNWWSCGAQSAEPPMGRSTSQPRQRKVQFSAEEPEQWDKSLRSLGGSFAKMENEDEKPAAIQSQPHKEPNINDMIRDARGRQPQEDPVGAAGSEPETAEGGVAGGGDNLYSYPLAPPSSREAREKGMIRASAGGPLSARSGSNSARQQIARPTAITRPDSSRKEKQLFQAEELLKEIDEPADKTVFLHEIDVKVFARGGEVGRTDDAVFKLARSRCNVPEDSFLPLSTITTKSDLSTTTEVGELTLPRIWALIWSTGSDFMRTFHLQYKNKKFLPGKWDMVEDDNFVKWSGSRMSTWTKGGKVFGKIDVVEKAYFVCYKFQDSPSMLYVHTSQRSKDPEHAFRVETVYRFYVECGEMYVTLDSKLVEDEGAGLSKSIKKKLHRQVKAWHDIFTCKTVGRAQAHLLKRALGPGLYSSKKGVKKYVLSASTKKKAQQKMQKYGASMGTLARFPSIKRPGMGTSGVRVRNLNSFLASKTVVNGDLSVKLSAQGRIDKIPFWKTLGDTSTLLNPNTCQHNLDKLYENLLMYPTEILEKEGFTVNQVLVLTKVISAHPKQLDKVRVLETAFKLLKVVSSVSLPIIVQAPNAVHTIIAAWKCNKKVLAEYDALVKLLDTQNSRGKQQSAKKATGASKTLMEYFDLTDQVLERYNCSVVLQNGQKHGGTLYVTRMWLCFLSKHTRMMISTYDITKVEGKDSLFGTILYIQAENKCTDPLDFADPHAQTITFEFHIWFQKNADKQLRCLIGGGRRFRLSFYPPA